jgi:hypothetical protein
VRTYESREAGRGSAISAAFIAALSLGVGAATMGAFVLLAVAVFEALSPC